ncbi:DinB family protein [Litoribacter populi]|uniref:DinB family protein n=1 Tax=Litoribacter populi TaxID=2598460 RepID=UPI00117D838E|nr:DinB family protein [Litoribacter populi]
METKMKESQLVTKDQLFEHWEGHRRLTRRVIEAFPENELFTFNIGGMRPFGAIVQELLAIAEPGLKGIVTGDWQPFDESLKYSTKEELLEAWDRTTANLPSLWEQLKEERFQQTVLSFEQYEGTGISTLQYFVDNEIHHRGQGYVYLRALGIEPPFFWERE